MDWRAKVELYEQIRREYEFGVGSVIGVARKLGVHRRMVREAVRNAVPAQRKKTERPALKMAPAVSLIDAILESDRKAPRKQRHTARRILRSHSRRDPGMYACGAHGAAVCGAAQAGSWVWPNTRCSFRRATTGASRRRSIGTKRMPIWMASGSSYRSSRCVRWPAARPSIERIHRATQQAFLEAHELAFEYFEGVFRRLRYDYVPRNIIVENP